MSLIKFTQHLPHGSLSVCCCLWLSENTDNYSEGSDKALIIYRAKGVWKKKRNTECCFEWFLFRNNTRRCLHCSKKAGVRKGKLWNFLLTVVFFSIIIIDRICKTCQKEVFSNKNIYTKANDPEKLTGNSQRQRPRSCCKTGCQCLSPGRMWDGGHAVCGQFMTHEHFLLPSLLDLINVPFINNWFYSVRIWFILPHNFFF